MLADGVQQLVAVGPGASRSRRRTVGSAKRSTCARTCQRPRCERRERGPPLIAWLRPLCKKHYRLRRRRRLGSRRDAPHADERQPELRDLRALLLLGERAVRFQPYAGSELVDVCALCVDEAVERGWIREGSPTTPTMPGRRRRRSGLARLLDLGGRPEPPRVVAAPILRRLSEPEQAMVEAAELFNAFGSPASVAGIARSLGAAE